MLRHIDLHSCLLLTTTLFETENMVKRTDLLALPSTMEAR